LTLLRNLRKQKNNEAKLLVLGLDNAGKTSCVKALADQPIVDVMPSQGFHVKEMIQEGFKLTVWDIGGQRSIRQFWGHYYENTDALIYVVDSADKRRVEETGIALAELIAEEKLAGVPVLVFANKQDLINAMDAKELAEALTLANIHDREWQIQPCSAMTQEGLQEGIAWVLKKIGKKVAATEAAK
jgi:ADP-ribosylation factor-like protein 3